MQSIRRLTLNDIKAVLEINAASVSGVAALDEAELRRLMGMPNHHLAIESADYLVVGYALTFCSKAPYDGEEFQQFQRIFAKPFIYIDQVATRSDFRRKGMGSEIYNALESMARLGDASKLCCEVNIDPPNPGSMAFHQNRGFRQSGILTTIDGRQVALLTKDVV